MLALGLILPLGAQNTFVLTQGVIQPKWIRGLPVVLTAAACDTLLIVAALSGASLVLLHVSWVKIALTLVGVAFLAYMGWATWRSNAKANDANVRDVDAQAAAEWPARRQVMFSASVSLFNPHAILDTIGVIGTSALQFHEANAQLAYTAATVSVSWLWFLGLLTVGHFLGVIDPNGVGRRLLNRVSALIMWGVGAQLLLNLLRG